jgi:hypothetical protein
MLHWFQQLRNLKRSTNEIRSLDKSTTHSYKYISRCFYGSIEPEIKIWEASFSNNEMRVILNTLDYDSLEKKLLKEITKKEKGYTTSGNIPFTICLENHYLPEEERYLNGDDPSENAYRISRAYLNVKTNNVDVNVPGIRFGHEGEIEAKDISNNFSAFGTASRCFLDITGQMSNQLLTICEYTVLIFEHI